MAYEAVPAADAPRLLAALSSDRGDLVEALDGSIAWFGKPSSRESFPMAGITHAHAWTSVEAFRDLVAGVEDPQELERRIVADFDFFSSLGEDGRGTVLFTGYYAPLFQGSRSPDAVYRYPLYARPTDLVVDTATGDVKGRRVGGRIVAPHPARAEIE
jgi:membrane-bound lytic murein transglycosylase A